MNKRLRSGKSSELMVASHLIRHSVDVYLPVVDDQAIDLVIRTDVNGVLRYYDVQVKSVAGYNRIVGLPDVDAKSRTFILVVHYRHESKTDEFFYLTRDQARQHRIKGAKWGDLVFNAPERQRYASQDLHDLAKKLLSAQL